MKVKNIEILPGSTINEAIAEAISIATKEDAEICFDFNSVQVKIRADSNPRLILRDWRRGSHGYHSDVVGPYPADELTDEQKWNDLSIKHENEKRADRARKEYRKKLTAKKQALDREIENCPLDLIDEEFWSNTVARNQDIYSHGIIRYAERWARLMQARIKSPDEIKHIAKQASHDADIEGITGYMYGSAVRILSRTWRHGEALRRWHNLEIQLHDEGEKANESGMVLNPAILCIGANSQQAGEKS